MTEAILDELLNYVRNRHFGKYRGTVVENDDPTGRGRLKVKVPAVLDQLEVWAMPCVPVAGPDAGLLSLPQNGAGVWVEFEGGDPSFAIWTGGFWADDEKPKTQNPSEHLWRAGPMTVRLKDGDTPTISIEIDEGAVVQVTDSEIEADAQGSALQMSSAKITVEADSGGKLELSNRTATLNDGGLEVT